MSSDEYQEPPTSSPSEEERKSRANSRPPSRKRSATSSPSNHLTKRSRPSGQYSNAYRELFNETVLEAVNLQNPEIDIHSRLSISQIGCSFWIPTEKETFYSALTRYGPSNLPAITNAIGQTKSIPEVKEYLGLLQESFAEHHLYAHQIHAVALKDIPAAWEMGDELNESLNLKAEALAWFQESYEARIEEKKYGPFWLITNELAEEIEDDIAESTIEKEEESDEVEQEPRPDMPVKSSLEEHELPDPEIFKSIPAARLLKPKTMLHLSRNLFMNPSVPSPFSNWQTLSHDSTSVSDPSGRDHSTPSPAIYHSCLNAFHTLVISLTRRLVQASIFQASSRLRAQDWRSTNAGKPNVRRKDVLTAVDLLGLKRNRREWFARAARRNGVKVYSARQPKSRSPYSRDVSASRLMSYDEVEKALDANGVEESGAEEKQTKEQESIRRRRAATPIPTTGMDLTDESSDGEGAYQSSRDFVRVDDHESPPLSSSSPASLPPLPQLPAEPDVTEDVLLDEYDIELSREEELRIYEKLNEAPTIKLSSPRQPDFRNISLHRKAPHELDDWRNWTEYRSEWEEFEERVPKESFLKNREGMAKPGDGWHNSQSDQIQQVQVPNRPLSAPRVRSARAYAAAMQLGSPHEERRRTDDEEEDERGEGVEDGSMVEEEDVHGEDMGTEQSSDVSEDEAEEVYQSVETRPSSSSRRVERHGHDGIDRARDQDDWQKNEDAMNSLLDEFVGGDGDVDML